MIAPGMLTGEVVSPNEQMDAFRYGEMRKCLRWSPTQPAAALGFSISAFELGLRREAPQLVPVKFEIDHVKSWLDHVESLARHVNGRISHVNCDLVHVNERSFSTKPTDGCISPWRNAQVLEKEPNAAGSCVGLFHFRF